MSSVILWTKILVRVFTHFPQNKIFRFHSRYVGKYVRAYIIFTILSKGRNSKCRVYTLPNERNFNPTDHSYIRLREHVG